MGCCLTKSKGSNPDHNDYKPGATTTRAAEPVRPAPAQPQAPSPSPAPKVDKNTILGKPFEEIRNHYTIGKELEERPVRSNFPLHREFDRETVCLQDDIEEEADHKA
ncbi:hypothetical protein V6N13_134114 [Hibiscus sabdariffa]